jgi:hypothetical protein
VGSGQYSVGSVAVGSVAGREYATGKLSEPGFHRLAFLLLNNISYIVANILFKRSLNQYPTTMKKLIVLLASVTFFACSKTEGTGSTYLNTSFDFSISNAENEDLLDPETPNHYEEADMKLFFENDGEIQTVYVPNLDKPRRINIYEHQNEYRVSLGLNHAETSDTLITYIQWNSIDTDTIKAIFRYGGDADKKLYFMEVEKVWLNDLEIWERSFEEDGGYYKLIK